MPVQVFQTFKEKDEAFNQYCRDAERTWQEFDRKISRADRQYREHKSQIDNRHREFTQFNNVSIEEEKRYRTEAAKECKLKSYIELIHGWAYLFSDTHRRVILPHLSESYKGIEDLSVGVKNKLKSISNYFHGVEVEPFFYTCREVPKRMTAKDVSDVQKLSLWMLSESETPGDVLTALGTLLYSPFMILHKPKSHGFTDEDIRDFEKYFYKDRS